MLAKANRIVAGTDYRRLVRSGRRARGGLVLAYGRRTSPDAPLRVGVIVAKNVGKAVVRNRVRRRIKAVAWELARETGGWDVVLRALPPTARCDFASIDQDVRRAVGAIVERS